MIPNSPYLEAQRRALLVKCGKLTQKMVAEEGADLQFLENSIHLDDAVSKYTNIRQQYVAHHKMVDGLLANHKVAAIYVYVLTSRPASQFFLFPEGVSSQFRRGVMGSFMYNIVHGVLDIEKDRLSQDVKTDLDYCLLMEDPANLEWLCFAMHSLCRHCGTPTDTRV